MNKLDYIRLESWTPPSFETNDPLIQIFFTFHTPSRLVSSSDVFLITEVQPQMRSKLCQYEFTHLYSWFLLA